MDIIEGTPTPNRPMGRAFRKQDRPIADFFWKCGGNHVLNALPPQWTGLCTRVMMVQQTNILPFRTNETLDIGPLNRHRRSLDLLPDDGAYIDAIGVPRGVPDTFKARNAIAGGFTAMIPLLGSVIETSKNTEWINYIYYNQQRLANSSRAAFEALGEQLHATTQMAWQNRMALDMLLAEKAPDGSFTKALTKLRTLSDEFRANSGIDTSMWDWVDRALGRWKSFLVSGLLGCAMTMALLALLGCCVIPMIRSLIMRVVRNSVSHQMTLIRVVEESRRERADAAVRTWRRQKPSDMDDYVYENID